MPKLISINIEGHKHLQQRVLPFLEEQQPDIICLQEVFAVDVPIIESKLQISGHFVPMADVIRATIHQQDAFGYIGLYIGSRLPIKTKGKEFYQHDDPEAGVAPEFFRDGNENALDRAVAWLTVSAADGDYTVATTHFIWSKRGEATPLQLESLDKMLAILSKLPPHVLCGDFNAPRGRETFQRLASHYRDNIPADVTTTIDNQLHKATEEIELVVDGLFSQPEYEVSQVEVRDGVSDHKAIVGQISRLQQ